MANKALFLDRDGVINIDYGYVYKKEEFKFIPGIFELCLLAQRKGYLIIIITNQSGIARGYYTETEFENICQYMTHEFSQRKIYITDIFHCPQLSGHDRKPNAGLFFKAQKKYNLDMKKSLSIGDKQRDIDAAIKAGVGRNFLFQNDFTEITTFLENN